MPDMTIDEIKQAIREWWGVPREALCELADKVKKLKVQRLDYRITSLEDEVYPGYDGDEKSPSLSERIVEIEKRLKPHYGHEGWVDHAETPDAQSDERERMRQDQCTAVMPMIGPLLDVWDILPNDVKLDPEMDMLRKQLDAIADAMEDPPQTDAQPDEPIDKPDVCLTCGGMKTIYAKDIDHHHAEWCTPELREDHHKARLYDVIAPLVQAQYDLLIKCGVLLDKDVVIRDLRRKLAEYELIADRAKKVYEEHVTNPEVWRRHPLTVFSYILHGKEGE